MHELAGLNSELKGNDKHLVNINHLIVGWEPIHSKSINKFNASFELGFLPARIVVYWQVKSKFYLWFVFAEKKIASSHGPLQAAGPGWIALHRIRSSLSSGTVFSKCACLSFGALYPSACSGRRSLRTASRGWLCGSTCSHVQLYFCHQTERSFSSVGPSVWNSLHSPLRPAFSATGPV